MKRPNRSKETRKSRLRRRAYSISRIMAFTFMGIILLGTLLLDLPFSSRNGQSAGFVKSLFTCQIIENELAQASMIFILTTGREPYAEHRDQQKYP